MTFDLLVVPLYLATYFSFVRLLRYPRNWHLPSLQDILATAALAVITVIFVSASSDSIDLFVLSVSAGFLVLLFGIIAAPSVAFRSSSKTTEFVARHGEYAGLVMTVPAFFVGVSTVNAKLSGLMVTAIAVELAWWLRNYWASRGRQLYRLDGYDLSVLNAQARGDLKGFAKRHGMHELLLSRGVVRWRGCAKNSLPCPFNLYVNRLGLNTAPCCRKHMQELCYAVTAWLREMGATYWIEGGTLLGAVRAKGALLPWEDDVDVSVLLDGKVTWAWLAGNLAERGTREGYFVDAYEKHGFFTVSYDPPGHWPFRWQRNRMRGEIRLDLAVYRRAISYGQPVVERRTHKGDMPVTESGWYGVPQNLVSPTGTIPFLDGDFSCPRQPERYLRVLYGDFERVEYSYVDSAAAQSRRHLDAVDLVETEQEAGA